MRRSLKIYVMLGLLTTGCVSNDSATEQIRLIEEEAEYNRILDQAETQFEKGEYEQANETLVQVLINDSEMPDSYRARLYLMKARLATAFAQPSEVRLWLNKLFAVDPDAQLDPLRDPPTTIAVWQEVRSLNLKTDEPSDSE